MKNKIYLLFAILHFLGISQFNLGAMEQVGDDKTQSAKSKVDVKGKGKATDEQLKIWYEEEKRAAEVAAKKAKGDEEQSDPSVVSIPESSSSTSSSFVKEDAEQNNVPCFIANIPAYVPSDSETDESDSEEYDKKYKFSDEDFDSSPFKINYEKRGRVLLPLKIDHKKYDSMFGDPADPGIVEDLCKKMLKTGFVSADQVATEKQEKHSSMVVGLNRPRSLSSGKNKVLKKELEKPVDESLPVEYFGMYWDYCWERTEKAKNKSLGNPPSYEEVQSFYKQLKKIDPAKARKFRRDNENNKVHDRRKMVPYRTNRENVKNHEDTKKLINDFRKTNPKSHIYLLFCDSDTGSFNGCLTMFTQLDKEKINGVDAMSTGYLFADDEEQHPMIKFAGELDMRVREATAKHIPLGVYYPEPALCIMVPVGHDTVAESFENGKSDYDAPQESPIILKQVQKRANATFAFAYKNPIIIKAPERVTFNKKPNKAGVKKKLQFSATLDKTTGKFKNWTMKDLVTAQNIVQSHAHPIDWAKNLLKVFELKPSFIDGKSGKPRIFFDDLEGIEIKDHIGNVISDIAISLLSRLFKSYDPISLANEDKTTLIKVLKDYDKIIESDVIPSVEKDRKRATDLWKEIDRISYRSRLKEMFVQFSLYIDIDSIDAAARDAGRAMKDLLVERLTID